jgi:K+-sensing histidine kinase KdpD
MPDEPLAAIFSRIQGFEDRLDHTFENVGAWSKASFTISNEEKRLFRVEISPMGEHSAILVQDITDIVHFIEELENTNYLKDELMTKMAHDMRSPLIAMYNLQHLLRRIYTPANNEIDTKFFPELEHLLQRADLISQNFGALQRLTEVKDDPVSLSSTLSSALALLEPTIKYRGISIQSDIEDVLVISEQDLLVVVFRNLLSFFCEKLTPGSHVAIEQEILHDSVNLMLFARKDTDEDIKNTNTPPDEYGEHQSALYASRLVLAAMGSTLSMHIHDGSEVCIWFSLKRFRRLPPPT